VRTVRQERQLTLLGDRSVCSLPLDALSSSATVSKPKCVVFSLWETC